MNSLSKDKTYLQIIKEAKNYHNILEGLSSEIPINKTYLTIIKQNNIIKLLFVKLGKNLIFFEKG